jgi:hypothetical protein
MEERAGRSMYCSTTHIAANNMTHTHTHTLTGLHVTCPKFLSDLNIIWSSPTDFRRSSEYQISRNVSPVGAELLHADRHTNGHT